MPKKAAMLFFMFVIAIPLMAWDKVSQLPTSITRLEIVPRSTSLLFAVSRDQLYRSTDAGANWIATPVAGQIQVAVHPRNSRVYALTLEQAAGINRITLFLSQDLGETFAKQRAFNASGDVAPHRIFLDPYRTERVYGLSSEGLPLVSMDSGKVWRKLRSPDGVRYEQVYVSPLNRDVLYLSGRRPASGNSLLFITHDQGKKWELLTSRSSICEPQQFYPDPFFARIIVSTCDGTKTLAARAQKTSSVLKRVSSIVSIPGVFICLFALNERQDGSGNNLWLAAGGGVSWNPVDSLGGKITAVAVLNNTDKWVLVATRDGSVYRRKLSSFS